MNKNYTVEEFIKVWKDQQDIIGKIGDAIHDVYVPFSEKVARAKMILDASYYREINGEREYYANSAANYMLICLNLIELYSPISIDFTNALHEFDLLNETGICGWVISNIQEREIKEFKMLCEMAVDDEIHNKHEIHKYVEEQCNRFIALFEKLINPVLENVDLNKLYLDLIKK